MTNAPFIEREIDLSTAGGWMNTLVVHPGLEGPFSVVLFYMDAIGRRDELTVMARRMAAAGYFVVLPNLYYRTTREFHMKWDESGIQEMLRMIGTLSNKLVVEDTESLMRFVNAEPLAMSDTIGVVGYCMSGPFAIAAAATYPDRVKAAASFHGTNLVTESQDSPHRLARSVKAEMYFGCAENDKWADKKTIAALGAALDECEAPSSIEWYPGTQHGFVFPQRPKVYDEAAAELHWERLLSLFARRLGKAS
ncbi:dienelactone hydrolase family protein [Variovorax humicola]|uniref:Dienelactone hydrolase family protein n=1 Tax=Variovorax humicola TaxID=1769758 RepID=A0ABU8W349_9BURK